MAAFVPVNCGAIPTDLMESELFGHKKGSFTGAVANKQGLFQAADGGTLFLDEIAELPIHMQVKLLRAIQEKRIRPVGAEEEMAVDCRILSATHKNLSGLVDSGEFRQDLYYRINVIEIAVPPLRERPDDVAPLVDHFLAGAVPRRPQDLAGFQGVAGLVDLVQFVAAGYELVQGELSFAVPSQERREVLFGVGCAQASAVLALMKGEHARV